MRDAKDGSLIGEVVIILVLADWRQQQQPDERSRQNRNKCKHAAAIFGVFEHHSIRLTKRAGNYASTSARQRRANAIGEIRRAASRLRDVINEGTPPQFFEWQIRIHPTGMIKITVDQPVEQMANVELAGATGGICVTYDVDRAAIGQQIIEFRPIGKFVDPL